MNEKIDFDFFGDGMRIFLDYIHRQFKKNPDYMPHPLIRAFECAIQGAEKAKVGETFMGVSQNGTPTNVCNPFIVVLEKLESGVGVKEIRNIKVDKTVPIDVMLIIFRLQILLDRIEGDCVNPAEMVDSLNAVIPGNKFYALGDRWKEARDEFKKLLEEGKIHVPNDSKLIDGLTSITYNMSWDEYPNNVRAFIGSSIAQKDHMPSGTVIITSPTNSKIEKFKVFDSATEFLLGKTAEYLFKDKAK
jgi:hypothetical protein